MHVERMLKRVSLTAWVRMKMKYKVKLIFKYSDVVHVEADSEKEAVSLAINECMEEYECFYDAEISEEDE